MVGSPILHWAFNGHPQPWRYGGGHPEPWQFGPHPDPWRFGPLPELWQLGPHPEPWRVAVPQLIQAVQAKDIASQLDDRGREEGVKAASGAIAMIIDDWCGTPPRRWPWPWPGPPPWVWAIASELTLAANSLQEGSLRQGLLETAREVVEVANRRG